MYLDPMVSSFGDELSKIAAAKAPSSGGSLMRYAAPVAAGAAGWETLRRANKDRKLGRQVRLQQGM